MAGKVALAAGVGVAVGALAAAGLEHYYKVSKRSRSDRLVALLRAQPGRPIGELARELYGNDSRNERSKTRALLAQLGHLGRVRNVAVGVWEAVDEDEEVPGT